MKHTLTILAGLPTLAGTYTCVARQQAPSEQKGSLLVLYYEEGSGSAVRVRRFRLGQDGLESLSWD